MSKDKSNPKDIEKRQFLTSATIGLGVVGASTVAVSMIDSLNPSADVVANASLEVDVSKMTEGQEMKVLWRGKPVFIKRRTEAEIEEARAVVMSDLKDPQKDEDRVKKDEFLVVIGVCTHLGCVPKGQNSGDYNGWFCPCHGSHYDSSGRVRKGPAPLNLPVPPYQFLSENIIKIG